MSPASRFTLAMACIVLTSVLFPLLHFAFALHAGSAAALGACIWLAIMISGWIHSLGREKGRVAAFAVMLLPLPVVFLATAPLLIGVQGACALFLARRLLAPAPSGILPWIAETTLTFGGGALCIWLAPDVIPAPLSRDALSWSAAAGLFMLLQSVLLVPLGAKNKRPLDPFEEHMQQAERILG